VQLVVNSKKELDSAARAIINFADGQTIWLFDGEMGAGKTTLIKAIAHAFGVEDMVQSPTFSIVNEYRNPQDDIFYHFDFYRIKNEPEALDLGANEYFDSGDLCFIEWPQKVSSLIPDTYLSIQIEVTSETTRVLNLTQHGR
jgi:tRNA threonylcarbamoyladenosine biosynthesis protein TsaE